MIIQPDDQGPAFVRKRPWWAWPVILAVSMSITLGLSVDRLASTGQRSVDTAEVTSAIQKERARATRVNCEMQNERHRDTVRTLRGLVAKQPPEKRAESQAGAAQFVLLIDAMVPVRNCTAVVRRTVVEGRP